MKLALIGAFPVQRSPRGGVESANRGLIELLLEQDPNLTVDVLAVGNGSTEIIYDGRLRIHARLCPDYRLARLRGFPLEKPIIQEFMNHLPSNTVVQTTGPLAAHVAVAARHKAIPCVFTMHGILENDIRFETHLQPILRSLLGQRLKYMTRQAVFSASRVTAISSFGADYVRSLGYQSEIMVIPNSLDQRFQGVDHVPHLNASRLVFVGNIQPLKGIHTLLDALVMLKKTNPTVSLHVIGPVLDESYASHLKIQAQNLGLNDCVTWVGSLDKHGLVRELLESDVLVLPSQTENLPQVLQEAGSIGLPFVASNVGGVRDFVPNGLESTVLFQANHATELAAKLTALLKDNVLRLRVSAQLKAHIQDQFSNTHIAYATLGLYKSLVAQS